jgi:hypothetical protein
MVPAVGRNGTDLRVMFMLGFSFPCSPRRICSRRRCLQRQESSRPNERPRGKGNGEDSTDTATRAPWAAGRCLSERPRWPTAAQAGLVRALKTRVHNGKHELLQLDTFSHQAPERGGAALDASRQAARLVVDYQDDLLGR